MLMNRAEGPRLTRLRRSKMAIRRRRFPYGATYSLLTLRVSADWRIGDHLGGLSTLLTERPNFNGRKGRHRTAPGQRVPC
jgi:hypothetical protein